MAKKENGHALDDLFKAIQTLDESILTDDFKKKLTASFDKAVDEKAGDLAQKLDESVTAVIATKIKDDKDMFDKAVYAKSKRHERRLKRHMDESVEKEMGSLAQKLDDYATYVAKAYMKQNRVKLKGQGTIAKARAMDEALKVFGAKVGTETNTDLRRLVKENELMAREMTDLKRENVLMKVTADLSESAKEKVYDLSESIPFDDKFAMKVRKLKDGIANGTMTPSRKTTPKNTPSQPTKRSWQS